MTNKKEEPKDKNKEIKFPIRKTINFNKEEEKLYAHINKQGKPFATYIKELIQEDMNKKPLDDKIKDIVGKYFEDCFEVYLKEYLSKNNLALAEKEFEYTEEDKNALLTMMGK